MNQDDYKVFKFLNDVKRIELRTPNDEGKWSMEVDFTGSTSQEIHTFVFTSSQPFTDIHDLFLGFDFMSLIDRNKSGNQLEFGRYLFELVTDGECVQYACDNVERIK